MGLIDRAVRLSYRFRLWRLRRAGLTISRTAKMASFPEFGSEPYLITIGDRVAMGGEVEFITHDGGTHVFRHIDRYKDVIKYGRITIHENCVIGQRVLILPGVTIGPNSVVAAGSVVSRNVPPGVLAAGNPAKPVMSVRQYAEWALAATPKYDRAEYLRDKRKFLMKFSIRGGVTPGSPQGKNEEVADPFADVKQ